jgi:hypothetical protein
VRRGFLYCDVGHFLLQEAWTCLRIHDCTTYWKDWPLQPGDVRNTCSLFAGIQRQPGINDEFILPASNVHFLYHDLRTKTEGHQSK